jgi:hypothetical protein
MRFEILSRCHPERARAEACVRDVYDRHYGAHIDALAPYLAVLFKGDGGILCAAGMRLASDTFFSEAYLDGPAEMLASACLARRVVRGEIVEISTLAAVRRGSVGHFLSRFVTGTRAIGATTLLFTATERLRAYLRHNGVTVVEMATARPECVADLGMWGSYYDHGPMVCLTPDTLARPFSAAPPAALGGLRSLQAA